MTLIHAHLANLGRPMQKGSRGALEELIFHKSKFLMLIWHSYSITPCRITSSPKHCPPTLPLKQTHPIQQRKQPLSLPPNFQVVLKHYLTFSPQRPRHDSLLRYAEKIQKLSLSLLLPLQNHSGKHFKANYKPTVWGNPSRSYGLQLFAQEPKT